jgi:hypothetical protein
MKRRHFLGLSIFSLLASGAASAEDASGLPAIRSHTFTVPARIETSPQDGGERLFISDGKENFQFFYASHDQGRRLSPYPFVIEPGKIYTFTVEERPIPNIVRIRDESGKEEKGPDFFWTPVLIRVVDGDKALFDMEVCELHKCRMERREIPITYGLIRVQKGLPTLEQERTLFPHRRDYVLGGCIVMPGKKTETMYVCPECRTAYEDWRKANPEPTD